MLFINRVVRALFVAVVGLALGGLLLSLAAFDAGVRIAGAGLVGLGLWLLRFDIARRTIRQKGLTRFIAACLLPGYVWLLISGVFWLAYGGQYPAVQCMMLCCTPSSQVCVSIFRARR
jgi:hypothetical protein